MLHFEGENDFAQPPAVVWSRLSDLKFLIECIPDVQSSSVKSPQEAVLVVRPGFSFIRGSLNVTLKILQAVANQSLRLQAQGKGIGTSNDVDLAMGLAPEGTGTRVHWMADVTNLGGLLRALPTGLLQAAAQKVIEDAWARVKAKIV